MTMVVSVLVTVQNGSDILCQKYPDESRRERQGVRERVKQGTDWKGLHLTRV